MPQPVDLAGQRFGRLVAISPIPGGRGHPRKWLCRCECGTEVECETGNLLSGASTSCGCKRRESVGKIGLSNRKDGERYRCGRLRKPSRAKPLTCRACTGCGLELAAKPHQLYCSEECKQLVNNRRRKAEQVTLAMAHLGGKLD